MGESTKMGKSEEGIKTKRGEESLVVMVKPPQDKASILVSLCVLRHAPRSYSGEPVRVAACSTLLFW